MRTLPRIASLTVVLVLAVSVSSCAPPQPTPTGTPSARVTIQNSEVVHLRSTSTGRDYDIYVRLPDEYLPGSGRTYPVVYALDGQWDFKLLDSIYGGLLYDGFVPEMIIIGITYSGENADYSGLRALDYTPVRDPLFGGGGEAPGFLAFVRNELIPYVESHYSADASQRVLMGSSFGGTFTLYAMFTEPALFRGYIAGSPIVVYGNRFALKQEADYARQHRDLPVRVFLAVGELEDIVRPLQDFSRILQGRGYASLQLETRLIQGEKHASNKPETYNRGLRFIFQDD